MPDNQDFDFAADWKSQFLDAVTNFANNVKLALEAAPGSSVSTVTLSAQSQNVPAGAMVVVDAPIPNAGNRHLTTQLFHHIIAGELAIGTAIDPERLSEDARFPNKEICPDARDKIFSEWRRDSLQNACIGWCEGGRSLKNRNESRTRIGKPPLNPLFERLFLAGQRANKPKSVFVILHTPDDDYF